jgi:hypothetical protein
VGATEAGGLREIIQRYALAEILHDVIMHEPECPAAQSVACPLLRRETRRELMSTHVVMAASVRYGHCDTWSTKSIRAEGSTSSDCTMVSEAHSDAGECRLPSLVRVAAT